MKIRCEHCGKELDKSPGAVNRARKAGMRLFCDRKCAGLAKRKHKTKAQLIEEKRLYDIEYRRKNRAMLKAKKAERHLRTYDPEKARIERKKRAAFHAEYCRRPSYKAWKREYDRRRRDGEFGAFADAARLTIELNREIKQRMSNHEIKWENCTSNKAQSRKRAAGQAQRNRARHRDRRDGHSAPYG